MDANCTIQLFSDGAWHDVGSVSLLGTQAQGWRSKTYTGYAVEWAIEHIGARTLMGLRVHADLVLRLRALFIPRFDRQVKGGGVLRLGQESIATLTGIPGFGAVPSHDEVCRQLLLQCTAPLTEVLEYIKRDVANLALGNKDNHARNTAVQRDFSGGIRLTPLYDFAPMYLHPDGIARRIRWEGNDSGAPDWSRVIDTVCEVAQTLMAEKRTPSAQRKALREVCRPALVEGLRWMAGPLERIASYGTDFGLEPAVHAHLKLGIEAQARRLTALN